MNTNEYDKALSSMSKALGDQVRDNVKLEQAMHEKEEPTMQERVRLRAALAVLEQLNLTLDQFPELTDLTTKRGRALTNLKHACQRELLIAWRKEEI